VSTTNDTNYTMEIGRQRKEVTTSLPSKPGGRWTSAALQTRIEPNPGHTLPLKTMAPKGGAEPPTPAFSGLYSIIVID
jgi:hypothetical protein